MTSEASNTQSATQSTKEQRRQELLAEVDLAQRRMGAFTAALAEALDQQRSAFEHRSETVIDRSHRVAARIDSADEIEPTMAAAVTDLHHAVDTLEADYEVASSDPEVYRSVADTQLRRWQTRLDTFKVQSVLAAMEVRDDIDDAGDRLARARAGAVVEFRAAADDARDVVLDVRDDVEKVLVDVRRAVERASDALLHHHG